MPYIKQERRNAFADPENNTEIETSGELNFILTKVVQNYLRHKGTSYSTINDVIGALEGAKLEFYRRIVAPYEDTKIKENGDVY